jgi:glycosyltransferase involved in cell wall biosynthesis
MDKQLFVIIFAYWHDRRFKKQVGGPIKVYELATNLERLGHRVYLITPKIGYPECQTSADVIAIPIVDYPMLRFISFQIFALVRTIGLMIRKGRPNFFYIRIMWSFLPMLLGKLARTPVILEVNDSPHRGYAFIMNNFKRRFVHLIDRISYRLSSHILPVTKKIAKELHYFEGVSWDSMTVLPSGANTELFRPLDKLSCCQKLGLNSLKKYVGFIGTFFHYQGIQVIIESAPLMIQKFSDLRFLLVGDGPMRTNWENRVAEKGLSEYFIFTGHVPYRDVPFYCGVMDICLSPLLKEAGESSAVKLFDYLSCGKPVVMSDIEGTGKDFLKSEAVILVKPDHPIELADAVKKLLSDPKKRKRMGRMGRNHIISKYNRAKLAQDIVKLCQKIEYQRNSRDYHLLQKN